MGSLKGERDEIDWSRGQHLISQAKKFQLKVFYLGSKTICFAFKQINPSSHNIKELVKVGEMAH